MKRNLNKLADTKYDLLIIGGGIIGACAAWDASLRGMSVALIDKGDFGAATSANSLKIIHGGLRYLKEFDINRMIVSIQERSNLMRIAPHLVQPVPNLIPTYGRFKDGKEIMALALMINDAIGFKRNRDIDPKKIIPNGRIISKKECLKLFPYFKKEGLTGGAIWYDYQMLNSERLTLSFLLSASEKGAVLANYVEVIGFNKKNNKICGVKAIDSIDSNEIDIHASVILNATGPWVNKIIGLAKGENIRKNDSSGLALAVNLVSRKHISETSIAIKSHTHKEHDPICGGNRFLFMSPWRESTLIGTSYKIFHGNLDNYNIKEEDVRNLLKECNEACPPLDLSLDDVLFYHRGLLPLKTSGNFNGASPLLSHHRIIDHTIDDGISSIISIIGVKYTTARYVVQKAIDLVFKRLGYHPPPCKTAYTPIYGGENGRFLNSSKNGSISKELVKRFTSIYGSRFLDVLSYYKSNHNYEKSIYEGSPIFRGEILHAVRAEMAVKLSDVVFRRTDMGTETCPPTEQLKIVVQIMGEELGWNEKKRNEEINEVLHSYLPLTVR